MQRTEDRFQCSDGTRLARTIWRPDGGPIHEPGRRREHGGPSDVAARGGVLLVHGMAEHRRRYEQLGAALGKRGFLVWAYDQRGHGQSAPEPRMRRRIPPRDDWTQLVDDVSELAAALGEAVSGETAARSDGGTRSAPLFAVGHSMGSLVVRDALASSAVELCGAVLMGTAGPADIKARVGRVLATLVSAPRSPSTPSKFLNDMTFAGYNARFSPAVSEFDWLSRDRAKVERYVRDPDCGETMSAHFFRELARGTIRVSTRSAFEGVDQRTKLLFLSGAEDPVGGEGSGVREVVERYRRAGVESTALRLFEGARHELLHETNREEVVREIADALDSWASACEN